MSYYTGNVSNNPVVRWPLPLLELPASTAQMVGDLPDPYYWWQAGALWGAMLDYYHYTGDPSYNPVVLQALLAPANTGPKHDYNPPEHYNELGNDDLGFWGFAVLAAAERNFPQPRPDVPPWLTMAENIFATFSSRWDAASCGGGVYWQVFESSPHGLNYKNSVTNGALFQLAARLARATGQASYADWAVRAWDWNVATGLVGKKFNVYDGAHASDNCAEVNYVSFSYTAGIFLHGTAVMAEHTGDQVWADRAKGLLGAVGNFFGESEASKDIMYEPACEPNDLCNHDMQVRGAFTCWPADHLTSISLTKDTWRASCGNRRSTCPLYYQM
jgi:mannan endo-1,6-alpha-mannosidase